MRITGDECAFKKVARSSKHSLRQASLQCNESQRFITCISLALVYAPHNWCAATATQCEHKARHDYMVSRFFAVSPIERHGNSGLHGAASAYPTPALGTMHPLKPLLR